MEMADVAAAVHQEFDAQKMNTDLGGPRLSAAPLGWQRSGRRVTTPTTSDVERLMRFDVGTSRSRRNSSGEASSKAVTPDILSCRAGTWIEDTRRPEQSRRRRERRERHGSYDKASVLRVEITINNPRKFRTLRVITDDDGRRERRWSDEQERLQHVAVLPSGHRVQPALHRCPRPAQPNGEGVAALDALCRSRTRNGPRYARFNPLPQPTSPCSERCSPEDTRSSGSATTTSFTASTPRRRRTTTNADDDAPEHRDSSPNCVVTVWSPRFAERNELESDTDRWFRVSCASHAVRTGFAHTTVQPVAGRLSGRVLPSRADLAVDAHWDHRLARKLATFIASVNRPRAAAVWAPRRGSVSLCGRGRLDRLAAEIRRIICGLIAVFRVGRRRELLRPP